MNQFGNISGEQLEKLISVAAGKLGKSEAELKSQLNEKNISKLSEKLSDSQKEKAMELLKNPKKVEEMLSNPAVRAMISKFMK